MPRRSHRREELEKAFVRSHSMPQQDSQLRLEQPVASLGCLKVNRGDSTLPLHLYETGHRYGCQPGSCPVTGDVSDRFLRLLFYNSLSGEDQERVVGAIKEFQQRTDRRASL